MINPSYKKKGAVFVGVMLLFFSFGRAGSFSPDDLVIWREFVDLLKSGNLTQDQVKPHEHISKETLLGFLEQLKEASDRASSWQEWEAEPEVFPVENHVHFLIPLGFGGEQKTVFCFTFLKEKDTWYYRHMENIFIRLDKTPLPPTSDFPDLPEETKALQRAELYWSKMVYFFTVLTEEKGREFFFNLMKDGAGYFLASKVWVPFLPQERAFILYLCWEQSRLQGNDVVLQKLTEREAVVNLQSHFFFLYKHAGHLKGQIAFDDYKKIFETIWQDRAKNAGWNLEISYKDTECLQCVFRFTRLNK